MFLYVARFLLLATGLSTLLNKNWTQLNSAIAFFWSSCIQHEI